MAIDQRLWLADGSPSMIPSWDFVGKKTTTNARLALLSRLERLKMALTK